MMGDRQVMQGALFYEFCLEEHVPASHMLRSIDRFVELSEVRAHLAPFYSSTDRPSVNPELLMRILIVGYCSGIRSERRLCEEIHLNLAYRWFCCLGLEDAVRMPEALTHLFSSQWISQETPAQAGLRWPGGRAGQLPKMRRQVATR